MGRVAQGVPGGGVLEADDGHDVAGEDGVLVHALVGVHLEDPAHPLLLVLGGVGDRRTLGQRARVDPDVGQLAHVGVRHHLEGQGGEGLLVVGVALFYLLGVVGADPLGGGEIERAGQVVHHGVEHGLDTLVLEGRPAQHGHHLGRQGGRAQGAAKVVGGNGLFGQVLLHDDVVEVGDDVNELVAGVLRVR